MAASDGLRQPASLANQSNHQRLFNARKPLVALIICISTLALACQATQAVGALGPLPRARRQAEAPPATTGSEGSASRKPSKTPPVNFTQVDELFNAAFEESEVVAKWRQMDQQVTEGELCGLLRARQCYQINDKSTKANHLPQVSGESSR